MDLVIVESPSKTKTIGKYLGSKYKVVSSKGHIRDLSTTGKFGLGIDIDYDPRLYLGHDTFSEYEDRTVFSDGSWQDAKGYYNASTGKFTPKEETNTYTDDELIEINNEINVRQKMSALAIRTDYFNYLGKALDSEKQKLLEETNKEPEIKESEVLNGSSNS